MFVEYMLVVFNETQNAGNAFVGIVFWEQGNFTKKFIIVHYDVYDTPFFNSVSFV